LAHPNDFVQQRRHLGKVRRVGELLFQNLAAYVVLPPRSSSQEAQSLE
jgi:hypothetical protein